jgi:hypothetical protein
MSEQYLSFKDYSVSPVDLIPPDEPEDLDEVDERQVRQARHRRSVDLEDVLECAWTHFRERAEVQAFVEDALEMPYNPDRILVHPGNAQRLAIAFAADVQAALDDITGMLDVVEASHD